MCSPSSPFRQKIRDRMVNAPTTELQVVRTSKTLMYGALTWVTDHGWPVGVPESDAYEAAWRLRSGPGQNWVYIQ